MPYEIYLGLDNGWLYKIVNGSYSRASFGYGIKCMYSTSDYSKLAIIYYDYIPEENAYYDYLALINTSNLSIYRDAIDAAIEGYMKHLVVIGDEIFYHIGNNSKRYDISSDYLGPEIDLGFTPSGMGRFQQSEALYFSGNSVKSRRGDTVYTRLSPSSANIVAGFSLPKQAYTAIVCEDGWIGLYEYGDSPSDTRTKKTYQVQSPLRHACPLDSVSRIIYGIENDYYYYYDYERDETGFLYGEEGNGIIFNSNYILVGHVDKFILADKRVNTYFNATVYDYQGNPLYSISIDLEVSAIINHIVVKEL